MMRVTGSHRIRPGEVRTCLSPCCFPLDVPDERFDPLEDTAVPTVKAATVAITRVQSMPVSASIHRWILVPVAGR